MERIQKENFFEFDVVIATPDTMGVVGRLGRVLGPSWPDAEPEGGYGFHGRCQSRSGVQGR